MAGWTAIEPTMPSDDMVGNQDWILDQVRAGNFVAPEFRSLSLPHPTDPLVVGGVRVMADALHLGEPGDSMRVTVSHRTAQAIADLLGLRLMTTRVADARDKASVPKIEPQFLATEGAPSDVTHMVMHSKAIDAAAGKSPLTIGTPGKLWINSKRLSNPAGERFGKQTAINYGGYTKGQATPQGTAGPRPAVGGIAGTRNVWQQPGGAHDVDHVDESQTFLAMQPEMLVTWGEDSQFWNADDVALHDQLWPILSNEGPVSMRHPWLARCMSLADGGDCFIGGGGGGGGPTIPAAAVPTKKRLAAAGGVFAGVGAAIYAMLRWL